MSNSRSARLLLVAITLLVIAALSANLYMFVEIIVFPERLAPDISSSTNRFENLRHVLAGSHIVGYISDDTDDQYSSEGRLCLAQYSLSPVILVRSLNYKLVVGNFRNPSPDLEIYKKMGLTPLKLFGRGVILFRREI